MKRIFGIIGSILSAVVLMPWLTEFGLGLMSEFGFAPAPMASRFVEIIGSIGDLQGYDKLAAAAAGFGAGIILMLVGGGIDQLRSNRRASLKRLGDQCGLFAKELKRLPRLSLDHADAATAVAYSKVIGDQLTKLGLPAPEIRFESFQEDARKAASYYSYYAVYLQQGSLRELKASLAVSSDESQSDD